MSKAINDKLIWFLKCKHTFFLTKTKHLENNAYGKKKVLTPNINTDQVTL